MGIDLFGVFRRGTNSVFHVVDSLGGLVDHVGQGAGSLLDHTGKGVEGVGYGLGKGIGGIGSFLSSPFTPIIILIGVLVGLYIFFKFM